MSVILEALKKAEHERGLAELPTVASVHAEEVKARRRLFPWALVAVLLVSGAMGIWAWPGWDGRAGKPLPPTGQPVAKALKSTAREASSNALPSQEVERPVSTPRIAAGHQRAERVSASTSTEAQVPAPPPAETLVLPRTRVPRLAQPEARQPQTEVPPPAQSEDIAVSGAANRRLSAGAVAPVEPRVSEASDSRSASPSEPVPSEPAHTSDNSHPRLREAIAKMTLNGVVYSEDPGYRKVYIGGRGYSEGDIIAGNLRIAEIHPEGATLAYRDERAVLRMAGR